MSTRTNNIILSEPTLEFEISECISEYNCSLDDIIDKIEEEYPGWKFNRTERRYQTCMILSDL